MKPQFWYEWGDEPAGKVSTGAYDSAGVYKFTGYMAKHDAYDLGISFHCPFS